MKNVSKQIFYNNKKGKEGIKHFYSSERNTTEYPDEVTTRRQQGKK